MQVVEIFFIDKLSRAESEDQFGHVADVGVEAFGIDFPCDSPALLGELVQALVALPQVFFCLFGSGDVDGHGEQACLVVDCQGICRKQGVYNPAILGAEAYFGIAYLPVLFECFDHVDPVLRVDKQSDFQR